MRTGVILKFISAYAVCKDEAAIQECFNWAIMSWDKRYKGQASKNSKTKQKEYRNVQELQEYKGNK